MQEWYNEYIMKAVLCGSFMVLGLIVFSATAFAYPLGANGSAPQITTGTVVGYLNQAQASAPSWVSGVLDNASQWFGQIMAMGAQSTGAPVPITMSGPLGSVTVSAQNLFSQFDAWLYGIIHFHVALIINFIFGLVIWILGLAKQVADWLNSTFHSAAGK